VVTVEPGVYLPGLAGAHRGNLVVTSTAADHSPFPEEVAV